MIAAKVDVKEAKKAAEAKKPAVKEGKQPAAPAAK
jgi:hypothetical protein